MNGVLVDFDSGIDKQDKETLKKYEGHADDIPCVFALMDPMSAPLRFLIFLPIILILIF